MRNLLSLVCVERRRKGDNTGSRTPIGDHKRIVVSPFSLLQRKLRKRGRGPLHVVEVTNRVIYEVRFGGLTRTVRIGAEFGAHLDEKPLRSVGVQDRGPGRETLRKQSEIVIRTTP